MKVESDDLSLLAMTVKRFLKLVKPEDIVIVTNKEYFYHVKSDLAACGAEAANILLEPAARNTAPAIALATRFCLDKLAAPEDEVLFVCPSDHIIRPNEVFTKFVEQAAALAALEKIVTLGIKPDNPETGYGYIQAGEPFQDGFEVKSFREKPDLATAKQYLASGNYYWNSGMFAFTINCMLEEFKIHEPAIYSLMAGAFENVVEQFADMPNISIDYAVAEKSNRVVTVPFTTYWNDVGSWDALYDVMGKDDRGNAIKGDCITLDCANTLMIGRARLIAGIGLEDLLVVETDDVIVVAKKGESQKVKNLVEELKKRGRREADEHTTIFRPWGSFTVLGEGPGYKLKKLTVNPGQSLSLQMHYHRSEHWIVTGGTAKVTLGDEEKLVHENESVFIPMSVKHSLQNPGRILLEIIEVQNGKYLGEDDIVRFGDVYGRV
jgi:mannose-1-phosphate guanylyltransferase/mannose-6-phosphate isomerase